VRPVVDTLHTARLDPTTEPSADADVPALVEPVPAFTEASVLLPDFPAEPATLASVEPVLAFVLTAAPEPSADAEVSALVEPVLALTEASVSSGDILNQCRADGPHTRSHRASRRAKVAGGGLSPAS
jgi:hypothetical protein